MLNLVIKNIKNNKLKFLGLIFGISISVALIYGIIATYLSVVNGISNYLYSTTEHFHVKVAGVRYKELLLNPNVKYLVDSESHDELPVILKSSEELKKENISLLENELILYKSPKDYENFKEEINKNPKIKIVKTNISDLPFSYYVKQLNEDRSDVVHLILKDKTKYKDLYKTYEGYVRLSTNIEILNFNFKHDNPLAFINVFVIIIISITSFAMYLLNKNIFEIAFADKIKQTAVMSSVGCSKNEIKKFLIIEGLLITICGFVLGLILSFITAYLLFNYLEHEFNYLISVGKIYISAIPNIYGIIYTFIFTILIFIFSVVKSIYNYSKYTIMDKIKQGNDESFDLSKIKKQSFSKNTAIILAKRNLSLNKNKHRLTTISIALSIMLFIIITTFTAVLKKDIFNSYDKKSYEYEAVLNKIPIKYYDKLYKEFNKKGKFNTIISSFHQAKEGEFVSTCVLSDSEFEKLEKNKDLIIVEEYKKVKVNGKTKFVKTLKDNEKQLTFSDNYDMTENIEPIKVDVKTMSYNKLSETKSYTVCDTSAFISETLFKKLYKNSYFDAQIYSRYEISEKNFKKYNLHKGNYYIINYGERARQMLAFTNILNSTLYIFIISIILISMINTFNVITSNFITRKKKFLVLKSIGISNSNFRKMIIYESVIYSVKAIIFGILSGNIIVDILISMVNKKTLYLFSVRNNLVITLLSLFMIVLTTIYALHKIKKENIIETIKNETV